MKLLVLLKKSKTAKRLDQAPDKLEYFRKILLDHLETQTDNNVIEKAGLPIGTIREWKGGKKYIKIGPNKWRPKYDSHTRGAKTAVAAIRRKVAAAKDAHEMMQIILEHRDRFSDKDGHPLPFVMELHEYINSVQADREKAGKGKAAAAGAGKKQADGKKKGGTIEPDKGKEGIKKWEQNGADDFASGKPRKPPYEDIAEPGIKVGSPESKEAGKKMKAWLRGWDRANISSTESEKRVEKNKKEQADSKQKETADEKIVRQFEQMGSDYNRIDKLDEKELSDAIHNADILKNVCIRRSKAYQEAGNKDFARNLDGIAKEAERVGLALTKRQAEIGKTNDYSGKQEFVERYEKEPFYAGTSDFEKIQDKYKSSKSITGDEDEIQAGKEVIPGVWKLVEADTPTASHDETTFHKTPGFPVGKDGSTINDRDYGHDKAAQEAVMNIASDYDGRALQFDSPIVVTRDGIVISGNNRTMSSKIAARKGTDTKYIEALKKRAKKFGFTGEQISQFKNPRVVFEVENNGGYSTEQFAKFNQSEKKEMGPTEKAVKVSKMIKPETVKNIAGKISEYETLGELYKSGKDTYEIIGEFVKAGLMGEHESARYWVNGGITDDGKTFIETALVGSIMNESNIRGFDRPGCKNIRAVLVRAITPLIENKDMDGYSINRELNEAVDIAMQVAIDRDKFKSVDEFSKQGSMFETLDPLAVEIAKKLEGTQKSFAEFMQTMNGGLKYAANGEADIFLGEVESREDILARMLNLKKAISSSIDAAINGALRFFRGLSKGRGSFEKEKVVLNRAGGNIETYRWVAKGGFIEGEHPRDGGGRFADGEAGEKSSESGGFEKSLTYSGHPLQGRMKVQGMDVSIENKKGSVRSGTDKDGHEWRTEMHCDYGYIRGTVGVDKDHLDAYIGPNPESEIVYIVNQNDPVTGDFDEQKVMLGFNSEAEAKAAYLKQYDRPRFFGSIVKMDIDAFKEKAFDIGNKGKPLQKTAA